MNSDLFPGLEVEEETVRFEATRAAGLARLDQFASRTGQHYARMRNYDFGPARRSNVSALSPWLRHRLISEHEVLQAVLARHTLSGAEKFIQEVFWRTYFKGWLEHRPSVWTSYQRGLLHWLEAVDQDPELGKGYQAAILGQTGIEPFDAWAKELVETGYLHNHTRMWFASIWIFTLKLPWQLGADLFLRHLVDGDPASNTLSWRWVGGLHTKGKTYLARPDNIAKYTQGRFALSARLAQTAQPLSEEDDHPLVGVRPGDAAPSGAYLLLVTEEDVQVQTLMPHAPEGVLGVRATHGRSPKPVGKHAAHFASGALLDSVGDSDVIEADDWSAPIMEAAARAHVTTVATAFAPVGPVAARLKRAKVQLRENGIELLEVRRPYDDIAWPYASKGFFALKKKIPNVLRDIGLAL